MLHARRGLMRALCPFTRIKKRPLAQGLFKCRREVRPERSSLLRQEAALAGEVAVELEVRADDDGLIGSDLTVTTTSVTPSKPGPPVVGIVQVRFLVCPLATGTVAAPASPG